MPTSVEPKFSGLNVLPASGHRRRQPVTLALDFCDFLLIVTAAQTVIAMLAGSAQFLHFALFPADERSNFLRRVQLLPADQLRLPADGVQAAALLPQFRGE